MSQKQAFTDYQQRASEFEVGDSVRYVEPVKAKAFGYTGRVTAVLEGIGFVDVEFPWGNERICPTDLVHVDSKGPSVSTALDTWERRKNAMSPRDLIKKLATTYRHRLVELHRTASRFQECGVEQMDAYHLLYSRRGSEFTDGEIKTALEEAYTTSLEVRQAMYWKEKGRRYVPTQSELASGVFGCPRCKCELERTNYKKYTKLYACPDCLFLIKPADILDCTDEENAEECEDVQEEEGSGGLDELVSNPANAFNEWL
jgi:predicted RNA-binding Zn-ribbon protein involved in translation (DUF1610 family)